MAATLKIFAFVFLCSLCLGGLHSINLQFIVVFNQQQKLKTLKNRLSSSLRHHGLFYMCAGNAYEPCKLSDLALTQTIKHHRNGSNNLEIEVTVENRCICSQGDVKLACKGLNSSVRVYPAGIIKPDGNGLCTLNDRSYVGNGNAVKFCYQSTSQISFSPVSSSIACSVASSANGSH